MSTLVFGYEGRGPKFADCSCEHCADYATAPFLDTEKGGKNEGKWTGYLSPEREAECRLNPRVCTLLDTDDHPKTVVLTSSYADDGTVRGEVLWCNRCGTIPFEHTRPGVETERRVTKRLLKLVVECCEGCPYERDGDTRPDYCTHREGPRYADFSKCPLPETKEES